MPYQFQLSDLKNSGAIRNIAGVAVASPAFVDLTNESQRRLLRRGNFEGLEQVIRICTSGCYIVWPKYVKTPLAVRFCDHRHSQTPPMMQNNWYSFMGAHTGGFYGYHGTTGAYGQHNFPSEIVVEDAGTVPMQNDIDDTTGKQIRYQVVQANDLGKTITLYGKQYGAQPLQEQVNGIWNNGVTLTAATPYASTTQLVTKIESVTRQATQGMAYLFEYDPTTTALRNLSTYEPNETNPRYRRSRIHNFPHGKLDANGIQWRQVEALVKLEFIPVVNDRDFLLIDNFDAIKFMIQAIKFEEANDDTNAEVKITKAIRELNFESRDKNPDNQTAIRVSVSGGTLRNMR
jgi:hypothetical protein